MVEVYGIVHDIEKIGKEDPFFLSHHIRIWDCILKLDGGRFWTDKKRKHFM